MGYITQNQYDTLNTLTYSTYSYYYIDDINVHCVNCSGIGIDEILEQNNVSVYPNPASNTITIESTKCKVQSIKIYNVLGEQVNSLKLTGNSKIEIDVSNLTQGVYFVEVETEKGIVRKKFVKE
ncbi:MAG: T9SS type A sorting domain-containing protein [Bacteroidota bacterium]